MRDSIKALAPCETCGDKHEIPVSMQGTPLSEENKKFGKWWKPCPDCAVPDAPEPLTAIDAQKRISNRFAEAKARRAAQIELEVERANDAPEPVTTDERTELADHLYSQAMDGDMDDRIRAEREADDNA